MSPRVPIQILLRRLSGQNPYKVHLLLQRERLLSHLCLTCSQLPLKILRTLHLSRLHVNVLLEKSSPELLPTKTLCPSCHSSQIILFPCITNLPLKTAVLGRVCKHILHGRSGRKKMRPQEKICLGRLNLFWKESESCLISVTRAEFRKPH